MMDVRGGDTLRIELEVEDASATRVRRDGAGDVAARGASGTRRWFIQMKGIARLSGRLGGQAVAGEGTGFFETYR
jgi:hypothetical protein